MWHRQPWLYAAFTDDHSLTHHIGKATPLHRSRFLNHLPCGTAFLPGGAEGIRTPDLLNAIQTRSQLRHSPTSGTLSRGQALGYRGVGGVSRNEAIRHPNVGGALREAVVARDEECAVGSGAGPHQGVGEA